MGESCTALGFTVPTAVLVTTGVPVSPADSASREGTEPKESLAVFPDEEGLDLEGVETVFRLRLALGFAGVFGCGVGAT